MKQLDHTLSQYARVLRDKPSRNAVMMTCNWLGGLYHDNAMELMNAIAKLPENDKQVIQQCLEGIKSQEKQPE